jgi:hypothetical protein
MEPRKASSGGQEESPQGGMEGKADGCHWPEGSRPGRDRASAQDTTGVGARGMSLAGSLGHGGGLGSRRTQPPWRGPGGLPPSPAPATETTNDGRPQGLGPRATSEATRDGPGGSRRGASSRGRWGREPHATHRREGGAGQHAELNGKTGATWRAPTGTPPLQRLAGQAAHEHKRVLTTLAQRSAEDWRPEAYRQTRQSSAPGGEGVTAKPSAEPLEENLRAGHARWRSGRSQAAPVERVWSEQDEGGQRPMGQPAVAATIVQRAVAMRLDALSEQDVRDCAAGVRSGRSPHQARHACRERCLQEGIGWIVEAAGRGDFASLDRTRRRAVLRQRGNEGRILRLIGQWLRAGVMADGG